jgi:trigger factor
VRTTLEDVGPWQKAIAITMDPEEVEREMDQVVARYRQKAVIPGFRKGKVPDQLVRSTYRESLESDLLNHLLPEATSRAMREHSIQPAGPPTIQDLQFRPGQPLSFTAIVDLWPQIEVQGYKGLELEETLLEVDEPMVDQFLGILSERGAELVPVTRASQIGDVVEADLQAVDRNGQRLARAKRQTIKMEAGGENLLPEFRQASLGLEAGGHARVDVVYPEDFGDRELAGKERHYRMRVRQILEKKLPNLDDSFARRIDGAENLEGLKARIRLRLEAEERLRARQRTEEGLIDRLIELNPFEVPEALIERSLERAFEKAREDDSDLVWEDFRQAYHPAVVRLRKREIFLESIARQEAIAVSEEELNEEIQRSAPAGVDPQVVRRKLEKDDELDRIQRELLDRKIFRFLMEVCTVHRIQQPRERKSNLILP